MTPFGRVAGCTYGMTAPSCSGPSAASAAAIARSVPTSCALDDEQRRRVASDPVLLGADVRGAQVEERDLIVVVDDEAGRVEIAVRDSRRMEPAELLPCRREHRIRRLVTERGQRRARHTFRDQKRRVGPGDPGPTEARHPHPGPAGEEVRVREMLDLLQPGTEDGNARVRGMPASATASRSTGRRAGRDRTRPPGDACRPGSWRRSRWPAAPAPSHAGARGLRHRAGPARPAARPSWVAHPARRTRCAPLPPLPPPRTVRRARQTRGRSPDRPPTSRSAITTPIPSRRYGRMR